MSIDAFAGKGILRHLGKCGQVENLDLRVSLRARRHHQEASQPVAQPVRTATDFEPQRVRENPVDRALSRIPAASESEQDDKQLIFL